MAAQNFAFNPQDLTVPADTTVTWTNPDTVDTPSPGTTGRSTPACSDPGQTFKYTFTTPGTYRYFCIPHGSPGAGMHGTIIVTGN